MELRGVGNVTSQNKIIIDTFDIQSWNSMSSVNVNIDCQTGFFALHTGSVDINLSGNCGLCYLYINHGGMVNALNMPSDIIRITNNSPTNSYVNVKDEITGNINYIGNIYYSGTPNKISVKENSSGKLIAY